MFEMLISIEVFKKIITNSGLQDANKKKGSNSNREVTRNFLAVSAHIFATGLVVVRSSGQEGGETSKSHFSLATHSHSIDD